MLTLEMDILCVELGQPPYLRLNLFFQLTLQLTLLLCLELSTQMLEFII